MKNKKNSKTSKNKKKKLYLKSSIKEFLILLAIIFIVGAVLMNIIFSLILILGILLIIWLGTIVENIKNRKWLKRLLNIFGILFLLGAIGLIGATAWFFNYVVKNSPEFNEDALTMSQSTKVYDADGVEIAELGAEKREIIKYDQLNETVIDALIATEDSRFFQHNGFDAPRFLVAALKQAFNDPNAGGGSTITMQVAKNSYNKETATITTGFKGIFRKFSDIYMAIFKIERKYSKEEIIEFYLNNHFLGNNSYGIEQGAHTYFDKKAKDLNTLESAILIGLYQAPSANNPYKYPENSQKRTAEVLYLMKRHGYITAEEEKILNKVSLNRLLNNKKESQKYYSYLNTVVEEAYKKYGVNPHAESLLIYTNMNRNHQTIIDDVMSGKTYKWENPEVQAGIAVVDIWTGKVLAIGGGRNQNGDRMFNYATSTRRQIGSTAKPIFDYGPGMEYNNWSTYKLFNDEPYKYSSGQTINNSDRKHKGIITLRHALAESRNIPALKAFQQVDNNKIFKFAKSLGLKLEAEAEKSGYLHEAYSIGSFNGASPLEMAAAYAAFGNGGYYIEPYTINKIVFRSTGEVIVHEPDKKQVMSSSTAFMITDVLKSAVQSVSVSAEVKGVNVAAKTGTTNYSAQTLHKFNLPGTALNDAWVIGYDPHIVVSIWYGYEPISTKYYTTNNSAFIQRKNLFSATAGKIFKRDGSDFAVPNTVVKVPVEFYKNVDIEPKLAGPNTPNHMIVYEYFKKGTEPTETSTLFNRLNDPTGLTAYYNEGEKTLTLEWNPIPIPEHLFTELGSLGYKIYKNGAFIGFTTKSNYIIKNVEDPTGTYRVSSSYQNSNIIESLGIVYTIDPPTSIYNSELIVPLKNEYLIGEKLKPMDKNPSKDDLLVTKDGIATPFTISINIQDKDGNKVAGIDTSEVNKYTITYNVSIASYSKSHKRTVIIN